MKNKQVKIPADSVELEGILNIPDIAKGIIIFVHGSGSRRLSPRNTFIAEVLQKAGFATLLFDLLTETEDQDCAIRFDINFMKLKLFLMLLIYLKNQEHWNRLQNWRLIGLKNIFK